MKFFFNLHTMKRRPNRINLTVIQTMRSLTGLAEGAAAEERCDAVKAGGAVGAGTGGTVVDVLRAVRSAPAVHAHTGIAAGRVAASATVLTGVGLQATLVHVVRAILT